MITPEHKALVATVTKWLDGGCNSRNLPSGEIRKLCAAIESLSAQSAQPANPAQVTDAIEHLTKLLHEARHVYAAAESSGVGVEVGHYRRLREGHGCIERLTAAIGAGGQAVPAVAPSRKRRG